jgi:ankyrin repeat protein
MMDLPLHDASMRGHVNIVRVLLDAGAIVDAQNDFEVTPLQCAFQYERVDVSQLLIDWGAKLSNIKLNDYLPEIPDWVTTFIESRSNCRTVSITIIAIHKYRRTNVTGNNDINVLKLISKHIWSTRMDDVWVTPSEVKRRN